MKNLILSISIIFSLSNIQGQQFQTQETVLGVSNAFGNYSHAGGTGISFAEFNQDVYDDLTMSGDDGTDIFFYENKGSHFELIAIPSLGPTA